MTRILEFPPERAVQSRQAADEGMILRIPTSAATLAGFRAWYQSDDFPETGRISFIDSEIVIDMTHEKYGSHLAIKREYVTFLTPLSVTEDSGDFTPHAMPPLNQTPAISTPPTASFSSCETIQNRP